MAKKQSASALGRFIKWCLFLGISGALALFMMISIMIMYAYQQLPSVDELKHYKASEPLRVWSADGVLIGEFGTERRDFVPIKDVPPMVIQAILSAEDNGFYNHSGIEFSGILRAAIMNVLTGSRAQGGSTITQQVARNFFFTRARSYTRKLYEIAMSFKIERELTKDQILEIYLNQIYLGHRSYGFQSAAKTYFGHTLKQLTPGEAATLAGLPVAPSAANPLTNLAYATQRRNYVLGRMNALGYLDDATYEAEKALPIQTRRYATDDEQLIEGADNPVVKAPYVAELARQLMYDVFGDEAYRRGLNVYTTINTRDQRAATDAVHLSLQDYDRRHGYTGPEGFVEVPAKDAEPVIQKALNSMTRSPFMVPAVVAEANPKTLKVYITPNTVVTLDETSIRFARPFLSPRKDQRELRPGSLVRVTRARNGKDWTLAQVPEVQAGFIAGDYDTGAIRALVGGFDFNINKFNHVTQALRQPGSSFKPFIYSAALDKGFDPTTVINDAPIVIDPKLTGNKLWEPKNYGGTFDGPMTLRQALEKSKNLVTIRVMQAITPQYAQAYIQKFGFLPENHPANLPMSLGAGIVSPWQMLAAYSVLANGGYKVEPYLIEKVTDNQGVILMQATNRFAGDPAIRTVDARNTYIMQSLLHGVTVNGTASRAYRALQRQDMAGKTGTTNDSHDAWFCGWAGNQVAVSWIGYDQPKSLGDRETGGGLALPIWIDYMRVAVAHDPERIRPMPETVVERNGELFYANPNDLNNNMEDRIRDQRF